MCEGKRHTILLYTQFQLKKIMLTYRQELGKSQLRNGILQGGYPRRRLMAYEATIW